ncbi:hypothetical protein EV652_107296 [Kribbella steppae]|uniref:Uncharacterized protein n=1 Tax=Kribbella steppae TaxID=2512223 RepID=A0A4R2HEI6_9ACTN|nr:hypothetical protein [Kribbella steppae]TCO26404.1 hypothetical protein EV652_107296 [Kribbella steppae]
MKQRSRPAAAALSVVTALAVGIGVGVVTGVIATAVSSRECLADEDCLAFLTGLGYGVVVGGIAAAITVLVLSIRLQVGAIFGIGAAAALLLLVRAAWGLGLGQAQLLVFLAAVVFAGAAVVNSCYRPAPSQLADQPAGGEPRQWSRPTLASVLIAVCAVVIAGLPAGSKLSTVWSEQQRIEAVFERPLQTDLDGTWPYSVRYSSTGIDYSVFEPTSGGSRIADIEVSVRTLAPDQTPCTGFDDLTEGAVRQCAELEPNLWQARGANGESRYFVHADERQWAYVRSETYGGAAAQRMHDARAEQIARSLEPRSAWPLAADSAELARADDQLGQRAVSGWWMTRTGWRDWS